MSRRAVFYQPVLGQDIHNGYSVNYVPVLASGNVESMAVGINNVPDASYMNSTYNRRNIDFNESPPIEIPIVINPGSSGSEMFESFYGYGPHGIECVAFNPLDGSKTLTMIASQDDITYRAFSTNISMLSGVTPSFLSTNFNAAKHFRIIAGENFSGVFSGTVIMRRTL